MSAELHVSDARQGPPAVGQGVEDRSRGRRTSSTATRARRRSPRPRLSAGAAGGLIGLFALVLLTWPLLAPQGPVPLTALVAHVAGMLAGGGVLVLLLLVGRTPALELGVGADVLARWHARGGRIVVTLVVVHGLFAVLAWAGPQGTGLLASTMGVLSLPGLVAATLGTLLMLVAPGLSVRAARRRVGHESWHAVHLLMYVAIALGFGFGHQLAGPDLVGHPLLQVGWALAYAHTFAVVLRHRVLSPLLGAHRHRLRVTHVHAEGPGVSTIVVGGQHLHELRAQPGQFFRWRFLTSHHWASAHPFSLSAAPGRRELRLTVKALGDGSQGLQDLPVGTRVVAEGPYGVVTPERRTRRNVVLVAGGVGITPMRALFEAMPLAPGEDMLLLYRARREEDILFRAELDGIAAASGARVDYLTGAGRGQLSTASLLRLVPDLVDRDVYVCGPGPLMDAVRESAREAGVPWGQYHEERFTL